VWGQTNDIEAQQRRVALRATNRLSLHFGASLQQTAQT
jgi:hypothetical protein